MAGRLVLRTRAQLTVFSSQTCIGFSAGRRTFATPAKAVDGSVDEENSSTDDSATSGATSNDILIQEYKNFKKQNRRTFRNVAQPTYLYKPKNATTEQASSRPFAANPFFTSKPIVSVGFREEVYNRVVEQGKSVRAVSSELGITMERVAAIARMMAIQKRWESEGKKPVTFLDRAIHTMVPTTELPSINANEAYHESINDLPEHPLTAAQRFVPVPESRGVSRVDAGSIFGLPPADDLIPHPELLLQEKEILQGVSKDERTRLAEERDTEDKIKRATAARSQVLKDREGLEIVVRGRWRWRLKEGKVGEIGARYGVPHQDRKKGHVKIPTRIV